MAAWTYFVTGFPGFIASQIVRRLATLHPGSTFELLVHPSQIDKAQSLVQQMCSDGSAKASQFHVMPGDITVAGLGINSPARERLQAAVTHVFHLAAIYDLAVPKQIAYQVNVLGTQHVNEWVSRLPGLQRYVYFSTAYVSGQRRGRILESELDMGQSFKNFYESTKFAAEVHVQQLRGKLPVTIIRPGVVMGDSRTGATIKFDGPYFAMRFLDKFAHLPIPYVGRGDVPFNLVPVDYVVDAVCHLAHSAAAVDQVYHLTDPRPYRARDAYRMIAEALVGKVPSYTLPASLIRASLSIGPFRRWVGVERETIEYFQTKAEYDCSNALRDLAGSGIACPDFAQYIPLAVKYYKQHRHDPDKRIEVR